MCHVFLVTKRLGCNLQQVGMVELGVVSHRKKTAVKTALPTDRLVETPVMRVSWMAQETFFFFDFGKGFFGPTDFFWEGIFWPRDFGILFFFICFCFLGRGGFWEVVFFGRGSFFVDIILEGNGWTWTTERWIPPKSWGLLLNRYLSGFVYIYIYIYTGYMHIYISGYFLGISSRRMSWPRLCWDMSGNCPEIFRDHFPRKTSEVCEQSSKAWLVAASRGLYDSVIWGFIIS